MNSMQVIGNLGNDPELSTTAGGTTLTKFSVAENYRNSSTGEKETTWWDIVAFGDRAETLERYLHKGSKVWISGRLSKRGYTDKDGVNRTSIELQAEKFEFLDPAPKGD